MTPDEIRLEAEKEFPLPETIWTPALQELINLKREAYIRGRMKSEEELHRLNSLLNTPEIEDFLKGVQLEQAHQIERWGDQSDMPPEHFILVSNKLMGKLAVAIFDNDLEKFKHHSITLSAVMSQIHRLLKLDWYEATYFPKKINT